MSDFLRKRLDVTRAEIQTKMRAISDKAEAEERDLSADEIAEVGALTKQMTELNERATEVRKFEDDNHAAATALREAGLLDGASDPEKPKQARELGEHFRQHLAEATRALSSGGPGRTFSAPEFRAATDALTTAVSGGLQTTYGNALETKYRRLTIADLLASGTIAGNSLTYWTQGTMEGDVTSVAEGLVKPSLSFEFAQVVENVRKLAGITKVSTEMLDDAEFLVSIVRSQLVQRLGIVEEDQLLNGNGTAPNIRGLLNRVGIQTYSTTATASAKKTLDGIFHVQNMVRTGSFMEPDGVVIHPTDYENIRLGVDGQLQYYGGGPFTGAYGNDGFSLQPAVWGLPTVVTPAIAAGTVLVGAFKTAGQVFRRGGVTLDSTNSNVDDFEKNLITLRIEERLALAVFYPAAFVKMTITA